jgi:CelD/BcsL family acetyltransferase involved in cellulose biosynthesis
LPPFDVQRLTKMPAQIDGVCNPLSLLGDRPNVVSCHGNDLRRSWAEIDKALPRRQGLMRKIRKLEGLGPLHFGAAQDEGEQKAATEAFLRQKQWRFEQTHVPGFDADRDKLDFFTDGTATFADAGMLQLFTLRSGDTILATLWGLRVARRFYAIMLSFEPGDWARFSPGSILYYQVLRHLHGQGYEWLDLGIGDEAWKTESCETTFDLVATEKAVSRAGHVLLARTRLVAAVRSTSIWQAIRPLKWIIRRRLKRSLQIFPAGSIF